MFVCLGYVIVPEREAGRGRERERERERERGVRERERERENVKLFKSYVLFLLRLGFVVSSVCLSRVCYSTKEIEIEREREGERESGREGERERERETSIDSIDY